MSDLIQNNEPKVNPDLLRTVQHLNAAVQNGRITAVIYIALSADGEILNGSAVPVMPSVFYLMIGALQSLIGDLVERIKQLRQQQQVSSIIKPPTAFRPNG